MSTTSALERLLRTTLSPALSLPVDIALVVVFVLTGLWHGAAWTFVLWGLYHGAWMLVERRMGWRDVDGQRPHHVALRRATTFLIVLVAVARYRRIAAFVQRHRRGVDVASGLLTAGFGVLVFTGAFARLAGLFSFGIV